MTDFKKLMQLGILAPAVLLAACGNNNASNDTPAADTNAGNQTVADAPSNDNVTSDDQVTIRIGTWESGSGGQILDRIVNDFMELHPNINVEVESTPDGFGQRLLVQLAANDAPDIFQIGDGDVSAFHSRGAFADLRPFIEGDNPLNLDDFYAPMLEIGKIDGGVFTLPKDFSTLAIYYNRDMFDEAGIEYPNENWSWDDFRAAALALTTEDRWGAQLIDGTRWALPLIYSFGGDIISADGSTVMGYMNSPETANALQFLNDMFHVDGSMPTSAQAQALAGTNLFLSENVAMLISGVWPANSFVEAGMNFGTAVLPSGPAGRAGTIAYAGYGMWADSPNPEEAWLFLNYLVTEGQMIMAEHALSAFEPAAIASGQLEVDHIGAFVDMVDSMRMFPERVNPVFNISAGREFGLVLEDINLSGGDIDIPAALADAAERGQEEMEIEMSFFE